MQNGKYKPQISQQVCEDDVMFTLAFFWFIQLVHTTGSLKWKVAHHLIKGTNHLHAYTSTFCYTMYLLQQLCKHLDGETFNLQVLKVCKVCNVCGQSMHGGPKVGTFHRNCASQYQYFQIVVLNIVFPGTLVSQTQVLK